MNSVYLQIIPLFGLTAYFIYLTYYYAAPMFYLKILLFIAHIKYPGIDVLFNDGKISARCMRDGKECFIERQIEIDPASRFLAMTVCSIFREMLRAIRKGVFAEDSLQAELPAKAGSGVDSLQDAEKKYENADGRMPGFPDTEVELRGRE